jgi:hypothetical protein
MVLARPIDPIHAKIDEAARLDAINRAIEMTTEDIEMICRVPIRTYP